MEENRARQAREEAAAGSATADATATESGSVSTGKLGKVYLPETKAVNRTVSI